MSAALPVKFGGTYLAMEGPQFSSLAESRLYRSWGCDVIGMTNMPEAKLAREAEICYVTVAMVTDFDCWHPDHDHVQVADIVRAHYLEEQRIEDIAVKYGRSNDWVHLVLHRARKALKTCLMSKLRVDGHVA